MRLRRDPLANAEALVREVYAYVAYRVPNPSDAEEVTSAVFERAVRYRKSYDSRKGSPIAWLIGIARTQINEHAPRPFAQALHEDEADPRNLETAALDSLSLQQAVQSLDERGRELIALRYAAGLSSREIARLFDLTENAVDVALHRAREQMRTFLADETDAATDTVVASRVRSHLPAR